MRLNSGFSMFLSFLGWWWYLLGGGWGFFRVPSPPPLMVAALVALHGRRRIPGVVARGLGPGARRHRLPAAVAAVGAGDAVFGAGAVRRLGRPERRGLVRAARRVGRAVVDPGAGRGEAAAPGGRLPQKREPRFARRGLASRLHRPTVVDGSSEDHPMNFQESIQTCFKKYADFSGRRLAARVLVVRVFLVIASLVLGAVSVWLGPDLRARHHRAIHRAPPRAGCTTPTAAAGGS